MLNNPELFQNGHHLTSFQLSDEILSYLQSEDWEKLDLAFRELTLPSGRLFQFLQSFHDFQFVEFIISIRDAQNPWEEDGIWHDDGSRVFAFSLSLTLDHEKLEGGRLGIRRKGENSFNELQTPPLGHIILFLTGTYGYEHKIHKVKKGKRIIIAGWCS
jgi:hypothetical protein